MSKHNTSFYNPWVTLRFDLRPLVIAALALVIAACGGAPTKPTTPPKDLVDTEEQAELEVLPRFGQEHESMFYSIEDALALHDWQTAEMLLAQLPAQELDPRDQTQYQRMLAQTLYQRGDTVRALQQRDKLLNVPTDSDLYLEILKDQQYQLRLSDQHLQSAYLGHRAITQYPKLIDDPMLNAIWTDLQQSSPDDIADALKSASGDPQWQAWLKLTSLDEQRRHTSTAVFNLALEQWLLAHPDHPASVFLPGGLEFLMQAEQARTVALMLPLSGRLASAGTAVRDGYLAAYYQQLGSHSDSQTIHIIDSARYPNIEDAYYAAENTGADIVVGPLNKDQVRALDESPVRALPVIALNRTEQPSQLGDRALIQLALAPQDEAKQLARLAFGRGHRKAMLIAPESSWGEKMADALIQQWQELGGKITSRMSYASSAQLSANMEQALSLQQSNARHRQIEAKFGDTNVGFQPRRRQDIDVVFILSNDVNEARSIKPLLSFYYAGNVPVLSTSATYNTDTSRNRDLAGVGLLETPWRLKNNPLRASIGKAGNGRLAALYALGADAYLLQSRFAQLAAGKNAILRGSTGHLRLNDKLQIERTLKTAVFDGKGRIKTP